MQSTTFFSIIIPTFNSTKTLGKLLESIIEQEFQNYEVVIVDGLSNDGTMDLVNEFAQQLNSLKQRSEKDSGIYDAMNKGVKMSSGQYLIFMGSDDTFYNSSVLSNVFETLQSDTVDVLYGNVFSSRFAGLYDGAFDAKKLFLKNICHQAIFFKRSVYDIVGYFDLRYKSHADYDHNIKWFFNRRISHRYHNVVVSNYADGGFSSLNEDFLFKKHKPLIFLKRAFGKISLKLHLIILKRALN